MNDRFLACSAPLLVALALGSCASGSVGTAPDGVLAHLAHPDAVEIYALDPSPPGSRELDASVPVFHEYEVLGRATLSSSAERDELLALVERGIEDSDGRAARCFIPRHGIGVVKDGVQWDYVICFECLWMRVYRDDVRVEQQLTTDGPRDAVTALFERHGLTIAP
ncbi:MAG: hypothetical protein R3F34_06050 [Planctomycetota bacterium]